MLLLRWHNGLIAFQDFQRPLEMHWKLGKKANATRIDIRKKKKKEHRCRIATTHTYNLGLFFLYSYTDDHDLLLVCILDFLVK